MRTYFLVRYNTNRADRNKAENFPILLERRRKSVICMRLNISTTYLRKYCSEIPKRQSGRVLCP